MEPRPGVTVIGAGAVGGVFARALAGAGFPVLGVISRTTASARRLAREVGAPLAETDLSALPPGARVVACCVPDDRLEAVAGALSRLPHAWPETLVLHASGALPASALEPLDRLGARLLGFHPLQAFRAAEPRASLAGVPVALEGDAAAVEAGIHLATMLGARFFVLPAEAKTRYHLAASFASNFLVTLVALVGEIMGSIGFDRRAALALMEPLLEDTWRTLMAGGSPEDALTGPIVRGDGATIAQHGRALSLHLPHLMPVYTALAMETVRVAVRSGRLAPDQAQDLLDLLHGLIEPFEDA